MRKIDNKKELNINEDNYNQYVELLKAKRGYSNPKHKARERLVMAIGIMLALSIMGTGLCLSAFVLDALQTALATILVVAPSMFGCSIAAGAVCKMLTYKDLKKENPDIDVKVDEFDLEDELLKYDEISSIPKDIELQKDNHNESYNEDVKEMSTKEKIEYFEREKEFWENYAIKEKYENKQKSKVDDIRSIND